MTIDMSFVPDVMRVLSVDGAHCCWSVMFDHLFFFSESFLRTSLVQNTSTARVGHLCEVLVMSPEIPMDLASRLRFVLELVMTK